MFKKKTFSKIWEEKIIASEKIKVKRLKIYNKKAKEIENIVVLQFEQAKKIIGDKLSMKTVHSSMFHFYFGDDANGYYTTTLYSSNAEPNGFYELYHYSPIIKHLDKFKLNIKLKELSQRLIYYARLVLKTRGIKV